jgi:short-subunit dehydrogenase
MRFRNKNVWITGASSGIGEALAVAFAKEGAHVILSARREDELKRVAALCGEGNSTILPLDLAATSAIGELTQSLINKLGHIDVLVNNGGISQRELAIETPLDVDRKLR